MGSLTLFFLYNLRRHDGNRQTHWSAHHFPLLVLILFRGCFSQIQINIFLWESYWLRLTTSVTWRLYNSRSQTPEGLQAIQCKAYRLLRVAPLVRGSVSTDIQYGFVLKCTASRGCAFCRRGIINFKFHKMFYYHNTVFRLASPKPRQ